MGSSASVARAVAAPPALIAALPVLAALGVGLAIAGAPAADRGFLTAAAGVAAVAGLAATSIGVFGGILVPGLLLLGLEPRVAAPISLTLQIVVIPIGALGHHRLGNVRREVAGPLLAGGVAGAVGGALVASAVPQDLVARGVGLVIVVIGLLVLASLRPGHPAPPPRVSRPDAIGGIGGVAGFASGISGAGWGPIGVKLLILTGQEPRVAVGSSLVGRVVMATAAVLTYAAVGSAAGAAPAIDPRLAAVLLGATLATLLPGTVLISRLGRTRAAAGLAMLSIALALPALAFGAG